MKVLGYSERGILNSLIFEISYSSQPEKLLEKLISLTSFPILGEQCIRVCNVEILVEQSFSELGTADAVLLIETESQRVCIFVEAKVGPLWTIENEYSRFLLSTERKGYSSNLFTQLYRKFRLVNGLRQLGVEALQAGLQFPKSFKFRLRKSDGRYHSFERVVDEVELRKIGSNPVVLSAVDKLNDYLDTTYFLAVLPQRRDALQKFYLEELDRELDNLQEWDVSHFGYLDWRSVHQFCIDNNLESTMRVFEFNGGLIYS